MNTNKKRLILIAGGTASGKSMIADMFKDQLNIINEKTTIIRMDNYYKDIKDLKEENVNEVNWDKPIVFDWKQLINDINLLMNGQEVKRKKYSYKTGSYLEEENILKPNDNLIIEGLFSLSNRKLRKKSTLLIYVDARHDIRMKRRINRDSNGRYENSFDKEQFIIKWTNVIHPMHRKYVKPTKKYATEIIDNNEDFKNNTKKKKIIDSLIKI